MDQKVFIAGRGPAEFFPVRADEGRKLSAFRVQADRPAVITGIEYGDDVLAFSAALQNKGAVLLLVAVQPCKAFRVEVLLPDPGKLLCICLEPESVRCGWKDA